MKKPKRVLFLERNLRNEKLGIMYLAGSLASNGHRADLIQTDKEDLDDKIRDFRPDFVAFSITTGEHIYALKMARDVKRRFGIPNILGGPHCTYFPEIGFERDIDFTVQGQGERAILDIVEGRATPGFHKAAMAEHLDDLPDPDREIFYQFAEFRDNPMKNVITSRACPYKCSYCFNHSQLALTRIDGETKQWFDRRSVEHVVREINEISERYPLDKILFIDDSFIQSRAWLDAFLDSYTRDVRLPWLCSLRVNCLDADLAERMFRSRLEMVNYAIESADPDVQQRLLHRGHISNADVIQAIALFDRYGVRARMQNMIGLPLSNPLEDALNTLQFNMRHPVTDAWCSIFQPYPRTALGQYCIDHGYVSADQLRHCSESFFDESRLNISHKEELYALQKLWYFAIEGKIPLDLLRILIQGTFTPQIGDELQRLRFACSRKNLYGIAEADPATRVDFQSRERWSVSQQRHNVAHSQPSELVRTALLTSTLPDRFTEILSRVDFAEIQCRDLRRYLAGEVVHPPTIYTIDDATGELADPNVSIFTRGVTDPDECDIRDMDESHFMQGMAEVRLELETARNSKDAPRHNRQPTPDVLCNDGEVVDIVDKDERHLNQYLA